MEMIIFDEIFERRFKISLQVVLKSKNFEDDFGSFDF